MAGEPSVAPEFGIYLHWPYCTAICPYCDFNVYRARGHEAAPLRDAIIADMESFSQRFGRRRAVSLFFGGVTPSLLGARDIEMLIAAAATHFELSDDCEITLEANPEDHARFSAQAAAGINRFSIGAQALDDSALKALGRFHDAAMSVRAIEAAAKTGKRVSLDLIYAREGQGIESWRRELGEALTLPVEHVSLYQLTIEEGTAFARKVQRGAIVPPDTEQAAAMYEATQEVCDAAGFPAYEISNHARGPGARARHNLLYWRSADWAGFGPGAHGRVTQDGARYAQEAQRRPADYIDAVRENGSGIVSEAALSMSERADEMLIMGLRTDEGVDVAAYEALRGAPLKADARDWLIAQDLIADDAARLRLTRAGRLLANKIAAELAV